MSVDTATKSDVSPHGSPWPFAIAFAVFGLGLAASFVLSFTNQNLNVSRAQFTIRLVMLLVTPSFWLFALGRQTLACWHAWRWFWTLAGLVYAVHFYYGLRAYHFSIPDVYEKQGSLTATSNFIVTGLWALDLLQIWLLGWQPPALFRVLQWVTVLLTFVSWFLSAVVYQTGVVHTLGLVMTVTVAGCVVYRILDSCSPSLK